MLPKVYGFLGTINEIVLCKVRSNIQVVLRVTLVANKYLEVVVEKRGCEEQTVEAI